MPQLRANAIDIEYESFGREDDPVVLLIMGLGGQLTLWPEAFCRGLAARGFRVIRFDNRDVGKSTHFTDAGAVDIPALMARAMGGKAVVTPYALEDMAQDAVGLLEALGVERAHIVGASMGGMIAQLVAAHHPAMTRSLVSIMSSTGRRDLPPGRPEAMAALMTPLPSDSREDRIAASMKTWRIIGSPGYPATDAELRADAERDIDRVPYEPTGVSRQMAAIMVAPPRNDILKSVRAPTLVIHGADDPLVPVEAGRDTAGAIPGAELIVVPGMGHDITVALTPVLQKHVGDFLERVEGRSPGE
ncbi:MAG TPA: alpha/beta fold hydrolase [Caulobacteraceae bacterium]|nr:alpha/beta fold hydrolase [Caulobacteraceae bacterium]